MEKIQLKVIDYGIKMHLVKDNGDIIAISDENKISMITISDVVYIRENKLNIVEIEAYVEGICEENKPTVKIYRPKICEGFVKVIRPSSILSDALDTKK